MREGRERETVGGCRTWIYGHWESDRGHRTDWADIGFLETQSRPRLCAYLVLASSCFWEGGRLVQ